MNTLAALQMNPPSIAQKILAVAHECMPGLDVACRTLQLSRRIKEQAA